MDYRKLLVVLGLLIGCGKPEQYAQLSEDSGYREKASLFTIPDLAPEDLTNGANRAPRIAIISHSTLDVKYLDLTLDNHRKYASKRGYDYIFRNNLITTRFVDEFAKKKVYQLGLYWQKITALQDAMAEKIGGERKYDWVMWIDADAVFTNFDLSIESIVEKYSGSVLNPKHYFLASREPFHLINAGVLLFYNNDASQRMLQTVSDAFPWYLHQSLPEQEAIQDYIAGYLTGSHGNFRITPILERNYKDPNLLIPGTKVLTQRALNSFYAGWCPWACSEKEVWQPGDFVAHFAVVNDKNRDINSFVKCLKEKGGENYQDNEGYKGCR